MDDVRVPAQHVDARQVLRDFIRKEREGRPSVKAPELKDLALEAFGRNTDLMVVLGQQMLETLIYQLALEVVGEGRAPEPSFMPRRDSDSPEALQKRLDKLGRRYSVWYEHAGDRHVALLKMTKVDLRLAIGEREARIAVETKRRDFLQRILDRMESLPDHIVVESGVGVEQIATIEHEVFGEISPSTDQN